MKRVGVVSTAFLPFVLLGASAFGYPRQEQQSGEQGKPEKQATPENEKGTEQQDQNKQVQVAVPAVYIVPASDPLDVKGKLRFHAKKTFGPWAVVGFAARAGWQQKTNSPEEWGQGGAAYGKRLASTAARSGIHSALAFGLDSTLHQDPRYYRSNSTGFWGRVGHALRGTILTRTDAGGETLSTWRIGSAYGSAFLSDM